ncbi:MAG: ribonuclease P protein component [Candidatus Kaiserbacteria bacterium]|nr:ribonuclease P protein component [Candidatus Kaiserbacteria bacterium]
MPARYRLSSGELKTLSPAQKTHGQLFSIGVSRFSRAALACVISKKVARHAVDRTKLKRRVRAALLPLLPALPAGAYVIYAKAGSTKASNDEIRAEIAQLMKRAAA